MSEIKKTVAEALLGGISPAECITALRECMRGESDTARISAVRLLHELETERTPENLARPAIVFCLRFADVIAEVESMAVSLGVKTTNAPDYVRRVAREEGLPLPHIRKQREVEERQKLASELPEEDAMFDEVRTMLVAQMRAASTSRERLAAAQELNRIMEFAGEDYHKARASRKAGQLTDDQIADKFSHAITGSAE